MSDARIRRVVVKVGSSSLADANAGLSRKKLDEHVESIVLARNDGLEVVLVSSGAVAAGFPFLGFDSKPTATVAKQAAAAIGQGILIGAYIESFRKHRAEVAQILLTRHDFTVREAYNNALNTLGMLLEHGVVPIVNENDTVAVEELNFGDNDMLAALVAALLHADLLVIFTDIDGLYDADPRNDSKARRIPKVTTITPEMIERAGGTGSSVGTGGMAAKLKAARFALSMGVDVFIGKSAGAGKLPEVIAGNGAGTYFENPGGGTLERKKQWIAFHSESRGAIVIDDGAATALVTQGKSLLPVGVRSFEGTFEAEEVVIVRSLSGELLGKGIVNYGSSQLAAVTGRSSEYVRTHLGLERVEVIHRDNWVVLRVTEEGAPSGGAK